MLSAHAAMALVFGSILFTSSALAGPSVDAERLDEARRALDTAKTPEHDSNAHGQRAVAPAGLGAARVRSLLQGALAPCLAQDHRCDDLVVDSPPEAAPILALIELVGELGDRSDLSLLRRLEARGFYQAGVARRHLLDRDFERAVAASRCAPPSDAELARARAELDDFAVIHVTRAGIEAAAPTAQERDDLAYFFASTSGSGPEVGEGEDAAPSSSASLAGDTSTRDIERDALLASLDRAKRGGDAAAIARAARGYLATFGYPAKLSSGEENRFAWGGAKYSYVMRDLAEAAEATGLFREAASLYRRADPGGGMCGTSVEYLREEQIMGLIRSEERAGQCRAAVPERLLAIGDKYGPERLARAGFDVERLYRGALVTINRDLPREQLREALARAPAAIRDRALARLAKRGPEDWERRVHAVEGLADAGQRAALRPLVAVIAASSAPVRARAITALGELAERPLSDPCNPDGGWGESWSGSSQYHRAVRTLGRSCATKLSQDASDALARVLLPRLDDADVATRVAAVEALGRIGSSIAAPAILRLTSDAYATPGVTQCTTREGADGKPEQTCGPSLPVREAAAEASERLGGPRGAYVPRLVVGARPRAAARL